MYEVQACWDRRDKQEVLVARTLKGRPHEAKGLDWMDELPCGFMCYRV